MAYTAATDIYRYGWQIKQFAIDPNDPSAGNVIADLAYPAATAVTALTHTLTA